KEGCCDHGDRATDEEQSVIGIGKPPDDPEAPVENPGRTDIIELGPKDRPHDDLEDYAHPPSREQRLEWSFVEKLDHASLDDETDQSDHNEGDGNRDEGVPTKLADHSRRVGTHHDELAVRHIDNAS